MDPREKSFGQSPGFGAPGGEIGGWDPGDSSRSLAIHNRAMKNMKKTQISLDPKHSRYD